MRIFYIYQLQTRTVLLLPFHFGRLLFLFSCLIALARIFGTMLNRGGENGHPCLVPDL